MSPRNFAFFYACVLIFGVVTSSPAMPRLSLQHFSPVDICLFMCNICFDEMGSEMMTCANDVCLAKQEHGLNLGMLKLGHSCRNFKKLEDVIFGNETD